jgi:hypothetical protein
VAALAILFKMTPLGFLLEGFTSGFTSWGMQASRGSPAGPPCRFQSDGQTLSPTGRRSSTWRSSPPLEFWPFPAGASERRGR